MTLSTLFAAYKFILVQSITDDTRYPTFMPTYDDTTPPPTFAVPTPFLTQTPAPTSEHELPLHSKPSYDGYSMYFDILDNFSGKSSKSSGKSDKQASGKSAKRGGKSSKSRNESVKASVKSEKSDIETYNNESSEMNTDSASISRKESSKSSKSRISSSKSSGKSGKG